MIRVSNLTKRYGKVTALDNVSFEVNRGEIVGILGPNGAGKTTAFRILACYLPATGGKVTIDGLDVFRNSLEVRKKLGYLPENVPLYPDMRVVEYLKYRGHLKGLGGRPLRRRIEEVLAACGLNDASDSIIGKLSKGYTQRVGLADSLIHEPEVLILDEPTIGLDPNQIRHIRALIRELGTKHTILLSSHILPEVEMVCDRVLIISKGKIVASDTPRNLINILSDRFRLIVEVKGREDDVLKALGRITGVLTVSSARTGEWLHLSLDCAKNSDVRTAIFHAVADNKWELRELREERHNLEDVFVSITAPASSALFTKPEHEPEEKL